MSSYQQQINYTTETEIGVLICLYMRKALLTASAIALVSLTFGGVAFAAGVGPSLADLQNFIKGSEKLPMATQSAGGCDSSSTSTNCAQVKTAQMAEQPAAALSAATSYTDVAITHQSGKLDEHLSVDNALKGISLCNTAFKTRQIFINGVDVGARIAQLASSDQMGHGINGSSIGEGVCNSMPHRVAETKGILEMRDVVTFKTDDTRAQGDNYRVYLGDLSFAINPATNEVFLISAYDGSTLTSIGKLK